MKSISKNILLFSVAILLIIATFNTSFSTPISKSSNINKKTNLTGTEFANSIANLNQTESDTITSNKITKVWYTSAELNIQVYQVFKQQEIAITVYNMLGKEVLEVFKGTSTTSTEETYSKTFNLPNGIYICIMQGKNFKSSEKFIISR